MLIQEPAIDGTYTYVIYEYDEKYAAKMGDAVKQIGNYIQCHLRMLELKGKI